MKPQNQFAEHIAYSFAHKTVPVSFALILGFAGYGIGLLLIRLGISGGKNVGHFISLSALPVWVFVHFVLITMRQNPAISVAQAVASVYYSWLTYLHFVPVIGTVLSKLAEERKKRVNPFVTKAEEENYTK